MAHLLDHPTHRPRVGSHLWREAACFRITRPWISPSFWRSTKHQPFASCCSIAFAVRSASAATVIVGLVGAPVAKTLEPATNRFLWSNERPSESTTPDCL